MAKRKKLLAGRERAAAMASHGAHAQLDRQGAHRPRVIPDKKRERARRSCRGWRR